MHILNKTPKKLTKIPLFLFWIDQSSLHTRTMKHFTMCANKGMCPRVCHCPCLHLPTWPPKACCVLALGPRSWKPISIPCGLRLNQDTLSNTPEFYLTNVDLTKSTLKELLRIKPIINCWFIPKPPPSATGGIILSHFLPCLLKLPTTLAVVTHSGYLLHSASLLTPSPTSLPNFSTDAFKVTSQIDY